MELEEYGSLMKLAGKDKYFSVRKSIVLEALKNGVKPTARKFYMSKNTVKLWMRRFQKEGNDGLMDRRGGPLNIPHKTSPHLEKKALQYPVLASCYGTKRLGYFFDHSPSIGAIARILS